MKSAGAGTIAAFEDSRNDWVHLASDEIDCERFEAFFSARGYEMHRHDTYAIGRTLSGVQSFHYRGAVTNSLPGGTMVLHPDEAHDGQAGAEAGFRYRMIYLEPAAIQRVLGGRALPFIDGGVSRDPRLFAATERLLQRPEHRIEAFEFEDALFEIAHALDVAAGGAGPQRKAALDYHAAERVRQYLHELPSGPVTLARLEALAGRDRWSLSRDFRKLFGTSPYRYLLMRRLAAVKRALKPGVSLATLAAETGFADQSHMTRHFKRAYGVPPAKWLGMLAA